MWNLRSTGLVLLVCDTSCKLRTNCSSCCCDFRAIFVMETRYQNGNLPMISIFFRAFIIFSYSVQSSSIHRVSTDYVLLPTTHFHTILIKYPSVPLIMESCQWQLPKYTNRSSFFLFWRSFIPSEISSKFAFSFSLHQYHLVLIYPFLRITKVTHPSVQMLGIFILIFYSFSFSCVVEAFTSQQARMDSSHKSSSVDLFTKEQLKSYCIDSNGTLRGLFSSWMEKPNCRCICYPIARMAVSVCEGCSVVRSGSKPHQPMARSNDHVSTSIERDTSEEQSGQFTRKGCLYTLTGVRYRHAEIWMSAQTPCGKCRCEAGTITCTGEPHHCPPLCLPGQQSSPPGPCCETTCRGQALSNLSMNFSNCFQPKTGVTHAHGDLIRLPGSCVDQQCHCVNGRWDCLDYCVPISELPCQQENMIVWDPFCCPRCAGKTECTVNMYVDDINNTTTTPSDSMKLSTSAITTHEPDASEAQEEIRPKRLTPNNVNSLSNKPSVITSKTVKQIKIMPGSQVALQEGHCFCLNSSILCSRQGRNIWHDEDCYFVDGTEGTHYPPEAQWIPHGDPCTECRCLHNRTYTCVPKKCTNLFLCPTGKQPITEPGECCPSTCGIRTNPGDAEETSRKQSLHWNKHFSEKPTFLGQSPTEKALQAKPPPVKSSAHLSGNADLNMPQAHSTGGCPPLDGADMRRTALFPAGSRLLLTRPCRSLLCICAHDHRWLCTEHCQPCDRTFDSIEKMNQAPQPPPGKCCPPCDRVGAERQPDRSGNTQPTGVAANPADDAPIKEEYEDHPYNSFPRVQSGVSDTNPIQVVRHKEGHQSTLTTEEIKRALKFYVLVASLILFCLLGLPMAVFIIWYIISRRRKRRRRQEYLVKLQRRRKPHSGLNQTAVRHLQSLLNKAKADKRQAFPSSSTSPHTSSSRPVSPLPLQAFHNILSYRCKSAVSGTKDYMQTSDDEIGSLREHCAGKESVIAEPVVKTFSDIPPSNTPTNTTRSVPASPKVYDGKPRRVKSALKGAKTLMELCSRESLRPFDVNKSADHQPIDPKQFGPHLIVGVGEMTECGTKPSMRRTASSSSTRIPSMNRKAVTLARASTWLTGTQNKPRVTDCFPLSSTIQCNTGRGSDQSLNRASETKLIPASRVLTTSYQATTSVDTHSTYPEVSIVQDRMRVEANGKDHWSQTTQQNTVKLLVHPSKNSPEQLVGQQSVRHHFAHAHRPTSIATRPVVRTNGFGGVQVHPQQEELRSPDTDNTSITDCQTPVLEKPTNADTLCTKETGISKDVVYETSIQVNSQPFVLAEASMNLDAISSKPQKSIESFSTWPRSRNFEGEHKSNSKTTVLPANTSFNTEFMPLDPAT